MLTMKRLLTCVILAALIAVSSVAVFAAKPSVADFEANKGFYYGPSKSEIYQDEEHRSVPTVTDGGDGVTVAYKGYYLSGEDAGGVHSAAQYDLNGLSYTVRFDLMPEVTNEHDCWISFDILEYPRAFYVNDFTETGNRGMQTLVRFTWPFFEISDGVSSFDRVYATNDAGAEANAIFGIKTGDVVTISYERNEDGSYKMIYKNGDADAFEVPYNFPVGDVFPDGKGYISIIGSCELGDQEGFKYTITDVTNGKEMTEEEKKSVSEYSAAAADEVNRVKEVAEKAMETAKASGNASAVSKAQEALDAVDAALAAIEAKDYNEAAIQSSLAETRAKEANELSEKADESTSADRETTADEGKDDSAPADDFPVAPVVIGVVAAVVVIAVVAVIVYKKKKQ